MPHNFQIFDQNVVDMLNDSDYASSSQRLNGFSGIAQETLANKALYQLSVLCKAIAQTMSDLGETISDATYSALVISIKKIFANPIRFTSTLQTINAGPLVLPHGLGVTPFAVLVTAKNVSGTTQAGYPANSEIILNPAYTLFNSAVQGGIATELDSTNITITFSSSGAVPIIDSSGAVTTVTDPNWKIIVRAST